MPLIDRFGRVHDNLRIGVTDRCNIRCLYCMPDEDVKFVQRQEILSFEEITRFARIAAGLGVRKLRVTGGEPLVRKDLPHLLADLIAVPGIRDVAVTTNAVLLADQAQSLYDAGLRRLNIHLDTLDRERFLRITRRDELNRVLAGIDRALATGFASIKLNAVAMKGLTDEDIVPLARFGRERGIEVRFIEFMPLDSQGIWDKSKVLLQDDMMAMLETEIAPLVEDPDRDLRAPATEYRFADGMGKVGFISSVSRPFCANCNRLRITADGKFRYCLFAVEETDMKLLLRDGSSDDDIRAAVERSVAAKWEGHEINTNRFVAPPLPMYAIGG